MAKPKTQNCFSFHSADKLYIQTNPDFLFVWEMDLDVRLFPPKSCFGDSLRWKPSCITIPCKAEMSAQLGFLGFPWCGLISWFRAHCSFYGLTLSSRGVSPRRGWSCRKEGLGNCSIQNAIKTTRGTKEKVALWEICLRLETNLDDKVIRAGIRHDTC